MPALVGYTQNPSTKGFAFGYKSTKSDFRKQLPGTWYGVDAKGENFSRHVFVNLLRVRIIVTSGVVVSWGLIRVRDMGVDAGKRSTWLGPVMVIVGSNGVHTDNSICSASRTMF